MPKKQEPKKRLKHEKLTEIRDPVSPFELKRRIPGWAPDTIQEEDEQGTLKGEKEILYVEEVLRAETVTVDGKEKIERKPFQPDLEDEENLVWILGYPLDDRSKAEESYKTIKEKFLDWLHDISIRARNYNASLYRLRRAHLKNEKNKIPMDPLPWDATDPTPKKAEDDFKKDLDALREVLVPPLLFTPGIVDFVQVNGYIVSIRAIGRIIEKSKKDAKPLNVQPGGSESSHWSLSSRFSSSMSKKSDPREKQRAPKKAKKKK